MIGKTLRSEKSQTRAAWDGLSWSGNSRFTENGGSARHASGNRPGNLYGQESLDSRVFLFVLTSGSLNSEFFQPVLECPEGHAQKLGSAGDVPIRALECL